MPPSFLLGCMHLRSKRLLRPLLLSPKRLCLRLLFVQRPVPDSVTLHSAAYAWQRAAAAPPRPPLPAAPNLAGLVLWQTLSLHGLARLVGMSCLRSLR